MQINIGTPCKEDWNRMQSIESGKHCASCNKPIIDIRYKTNQELSSIIQGNGTDGLCIKANKSQLSDHQYVKPIRRLAFALIIVFGNALFSLSVSAQQATQQLKETYLTKENKTTNLSGIVKDDTGETLPFVIVDLILKNKVIASDTTDFDGKYNIELDKLYTNKAIAIKVSYVGYMQQTKNDVLVREENINNNFTLISHSEIMGDMIFIEEPRKKCKKNKQK